MEKHPSAPSLALRSRQARLTAVQWLFHNHKFPTAPSNLEDIQSVLRSEFGKDFAPDPVILRKILKAHHQNSEKINELIRGHLPSQWALERLDPVILSILRGALAETFTQRTPFKVILREYDSISATFYGEKEIHFIHKVINGILTAIGYADPQKNAEETPTR